MGSFSENLAYILTFCASNTTRELRPRAYLKTCSFAVLKPKDQDYCSTPAQLAELGEALDILRNVEKFKECKLYETNAVLKERLFPNWKILQIKLLLR
jgi:hypothetical protein